MEEVPKELNAKAYVMTLKEKEVLNQWLDEQLKAELIVESKSRYCYDQCLLGTAWTWVKDTMI